MNQRQILHIIVFIAVLMTAMITGCASFKGAIIEKVENRQVEYALVKHNTEAVVFENGLGAKINSWAKIFPEISKDATAFVYNRPGYGKSDLVSSPRDDMHVVDELRSLLRS